jgi:hypothetical protein
MQHATLMRCFLVMCVAILAVLHSDMVHLIERSGCPALATNVVGRAHHCCAKFFKFRAGLIWSMPRLMKRMMLFLG